MKTPINININNEAKKVQLRRRLKFGALSVALSAVVIAAVITVNIIISSLVSSNRLYVDLTGSNLFTLSEDAKEFLNEIKAPITIKFAVPEDTVKSNYQLFMVNLAATQFSKASKEEDKENKIPDITVEYYDTYKNPAEFEKYKQRITSAWSSSNVVIEPTLESEEGTESAIPLIYTLESFFTKDNSGNITKFNGERRFLLAFLALAGIEQPVVVFTTGHGEPIGTSPSDSANEYSAFTGLFEELGFSVRYSDLSDKNEVLGSDCRLVVILDPQSDFMEKDLGSLEDVSELDKISKFVSDNGSLMVFLGPTGVEHPTLDQYLEEWGVKVYTKYTIEDTENSRYISDGSSFFANYTQEGYGAELLQNFRNLRTKFQHASPVQIIFSGKSETEAKNVTSALRSSSSAKAYASETDIISPADIGKADGFDLFVVSRRLVYEKNESYYAYVLTCGCPEMLKYCGSQAFANDGIISNLVSKIPLKKIPPTGITGKNLEDYGLSSISNDQAKAWMIVLAVVLPVITFGVGTVVVIKRKRR